MFKIIKRIEKTPMPMKEGYEVIETKVTIKLFFLGLNFITIPVSEFHFTKRFAD
jgi:hypothetical protein